jgi:adenosine deaminase
MTTKTSHLPKVVLHDHLIGGLRPSTFIELASAAGYRRLPTSDPVRLETWIRSAGAGNLEKLLWTIDHGVAVTRTSQAIERMAFEAVEDLALDGVIYAEVRMAPGPNSGRDLSNGDVVDAVLAGMGRAADSHNIEARLVLTALRDGTDSAEITRMAVDRRDQGVVGFDLAGKETDQALSNHAEAIRIALDGGIGVTIHAGEEAGPDSIIEALDAGAQRIGVAYTLRYDITEQPDGTVVLGSIAQRLFDEQTPVELCPTSDGVLHGIQPAHHHFEQLYPAGLNVSLNTDNRLISGSSMTGEFELAVRFLGLEIDDLRKMTLRAIDAAFCDDDTKESLRRQVDADHEIEPEAG